MPYVLKELNVPVYGTELTLGLIENKLAEHDMQKSVEMITVKAGQKIQLGPFKIEFVRTTHSIADAVSIAIDTPVGLVFHTGDFKIDHTPIEGIPLTFRGWLNLERKVSCCCWQTAPMLKDRATPCRKEQWAKLLIQFFPVRRAG